MAKLVTLVSMFTILVCVCLPLFYVVDFSSTYAETNIDSDGIHYSVQGE